MSYIVKQKIKGRTYAYEVVSYWDPEKKQARQRRKYLGVWDEESQSIKPKTSQRSVKVAKTFGPAYLLSRLANDEVVKLRERLKVSFGDDGDRILALAIARIINPTSLKNLRHVIEDSFLLEMYSLEDSFNSQWMSSFLERVGTSLEEAQDFFASLIKSSDKDALIYDITSLSSSSRHMSWLEFGYNRDGVHLPQVNLGLVMSTSQQIPIYYKVFPGSVNDVSTLSNLIAELQSYGISSCTLILDRGFYSESNLIEMNKSGIDYIIPLPFNVKVGKNLLSATNHDITSPTNARRFRGEVYYVMDTTAHIGAMDVHGYVIYDKGRESKETATFFNRLIDIESKLDGKRIYGDPREYFERTAGSFKRYLRVESVNGRLKVSRRPKAISQVVNRFGKMILLSSREMKWDEALTWYREREEVERQYLTLKRDLEAMPLRVQKMETFNGLLLVFFISLILRSLLIQRAKSNGLLEKQSIEEILLDLSKLRAVYIGGRWRLTEITRRQKTNLEKIGVEIPRDPET